MSDDYGPPPTKKAGDINDYRNIPAYVDRRTCIRILGISENALNNWETRPDNPLPRYKPGKKVYYEAKELFEWYHNHRMEKEFGKGGPANMQRHQPNRPKQNLLSDQKPPSTANAAKIRLDEAKAEAQEIKNEVTRGELAPILILETALADICAQMASILGAIPSRLRKKYKWLKASQIDEISSEIVKAQNAASECNLNLPDRPSELEDAPNDSETSFEALVGLESPPPDQRI